MVGDADQFQKGEEAEERASPSVVYRFGHDLAAAGEARRELRPVVGDGPIGADVSLVASELVTNAIRHTEDGGEMRAWSADPLRLEVEDTSPVLPAAKPHQASGGKGLGIIDALASQWGADRTETGKVVWAEFPLAPPDGSNSESASNRPTGEG